VKAVASRGKQQAKVITTCGALRTKIADALGRGRRIGLVPTMGALHMGHLSLVEACCDECDFNVVSIFVNPTQFGPQEDFTKYPRNLESDLDRLSDYAVQLVFAPDVDEMYPSGCETTVDVGAVAEPWEGAFRPGHFRGVATVVLKLFNLAQPDVAYFGQKDFQQTAVVRRMVRDLNLPIEVRVCPTLRDADGLALSSRNVYLSPAERRQALALSRGLRRAEQLVTSGERTAATVRRAVLDVLESQPDIKVQYVAVADPDTLQEVSDINGRTVIAVAAYVGATRLIDNLLCDPPVRLHS
jgi:pantoate--beta-alanine ligase